jgi:hypothetical protein
MKKGKAAKDEPIMCRTDTKVYKTLVAEHSMAALIDRLGPRFNYPGAHSIVDFVLDEELQERHLRMGTFREMELHTMSLYRANNGEEEGEATWAGRATLITGCDKSFLKSEYEAFCSCYNHEKEAGIFKGHKGTVVEFAPSFFKKVVYTVKQLEDYLATGRSDLLGIFAISVAKMGLVGVQLVAIPLDPERLQGYLDKRDETMAQRDEKTKEPPICRFYRDKIKVKLYKSRAAAAAAEQSKPTTVSDTNGGGGIKRRRSTSAQARSEDEEEDSEATEPLPPPPPKRARLGEKEITPLDPIAAFDMVKDPSNDENDDDKNEEEEEEEEEEKEKEESKHNLAVGPYALHMEGRRTLPCPPHLRSSPSPHLPTGGKKPRTDQLPVLVTSKSDLDLVRHTREAVHSLTESTGEVKDEVVILRQRLDYWADMTKKMEEKVKKECKRADEIEAYYKVLMERVHLLERKSHLQPTAPY